MTRTRFEISMKPEHKISTYRLNHTFRLVVCLWANPKCFIYNYDISSPVRSLLSLLEPYFHLHSLKSKGVWPIMQNISRNRINLLKIYTHHHQ